MDMYFYFGLELKNFLFRGYNVETYMGMIWTCIGLSCLSILNEFLKLARFEIHNSSLSKPSNGLERPFVAQGTEMGTETTGLLDGLGTRRRRRRHYASVDRGLNWGLPTLSRSFVVKLSSTVLLFVQLFISYTVMLSVMCFNVWIILAVCLGSTFGHWLFFIRSNSSPPTQFFFQSDSCHDLGPGFEEQATEPCYGAIAASTTDGSAHRFNQAKNNTLEATETTDGNVVTADVHHQL